MNGPQDVRKVAVYGKGGIGKSTVSSNVSAALSQMGLKVMQVGCDPKHDSIATLCGKLMPTVMDTTREKGVSEEVMISLVHKGFNDILGIESGGPKPGTGCAGKGVMIVLQLLEEYKIFEKFDVQFALFDVLGDLVCGGFAQPMRAGYAREMYIVTCGESLTLYQMNNIAQSARKLHEMGKNCAVAGLINNMRGVKNEEAIVEAAGEIMGVPVIGHIPRSKTVQDAEMGGKTVIEAFPDSDQAEVYRVLAKRILDNEETFVPKPLTMEDLKQIIIKYC